MWSSANKLSLLLLLISLSCFAQVSDTADNQLFRQKLESIAESIPSEDIDFTSFDDQLQYFKKHPININKAGREQLQKLLLLDDIHINNLLNHIAANGPLLNIYELQAVEGFDTETVNNLLPYIKVTDNAVLLNEKLNDPKHVVWLRYQRVLEKQKGYLIPSTGSNNYYAGSPDKFFTRYKFTVSNKIRVGLTAEKDPGEDFFKGKQKQGFDFYSAHIFAQDIGSLKTAALGDYQLQFGQGLVAWSGVAFNKTPDVISIKRNGFGILPYTSVDENRFFRGAAGTYCFKKMELTGFFSRKNIDANIADTLATGEIASVSSFQTTGEHATDAEWSDKHSIQQTIVGSDVSFKSNKFDMGITTMYTQLSAPLQHDIKLYNAYQFAGKQLFNAGTHYNILLHNFNYFGETALSDNGGVAYVNGVLVSLDRKVSFSLLNRNYRRNYQSLMSNAFAEASTPANERGTYMGLQIKPAAAININSYMDIFSFPWVKYQITAPSHGYEYFTQINYLFNKNFEVYARVRIKQKFNDLNYLSGLNVPVPVKQNNYRLNISYRLSNALRLSGRVEYLTWQQQTLPSEKGFLMYQDIHIRPFKSPLVFTLRYALFSTDSYNSRIYAYETDMPFTYSIPAYYNKGSRVYIMLNYLLNKHFSVWLRYGQTFYDNVNVISPGALTEINNNTKTDIKAELKYTF